VPAKRYLREFRFDDISNYAVGSELKVDQFAQGDKVDVSGISKGHGYTGAIQRWNQHTGPMAHGSKYHRGVGSLSANSDPSRVFKGKHMSGQYGAEKVTVQNLEVVSVDAERNLLLIKGALPGANESLLVIRDSIKA
jgi:large subunit ribosomal protein L3